MNTFKLKIKNNQVEARRMAQKVRATAVLPGDQGSIPCTWIVAQVQGASHMHMGHWHKCKQNDISIKIQEVGRR